MSGQRAPALTRPYFVAFRPTPRARTIPDSFRCDRLPMPERRCRTTSQEGDPPGQGVPAGSARPAAAVRRPDTGMEPGAERACLAGQRDRPAGSCAATIRRAPSCPTKRKWSETFNVSRSAVREAIKMLMAKSLLASRPKIGSWVEPQRALEPARSRRARLVRDLAGPRIVPAHRAGIPPHHRAGSHRLAADAAQRRADGGDQPGLPGDGPSHDICRSARVPTRASTLRYCGLPATSCWCRSAC